MKITKQQLKQIILEELQLLSEEPYDHLSPEQRRMMSGKPYYRRKSREEYLEDEEYYRKETEKRKNDIERAIQDAIKGEQSAPPTAQPGKRWIQSASYEIAYKAGLQGVQDAKNGKPKDQDIVDEYEEHINNGYSPLLFPRGKAYLEAYERQSKLQEK